jgi:large subunit ribosomal protein L7/L12
LSRRALPVPLLRHRQHEENVVCGETSASCQTRTASSSLTSSCVHRSLSTSAAAAAAPDSRGDTTTAEFRHAKSKELFDRITANLTQDDVVLLASEINAILGRPVRENEFYYKGFGGRRAGGGGAAAAGAPRQGADGDASASAEAKTSFDLRLVAFDATAKLKVIKEVRSMLGLGLKEAKELVESAPKILQKGLAADKAEELKAKLSEIGAEVELV